MNRITTVFYIGVELDFERKGNVVKGNSIHGIPLHLFMSK